jgi:hypothetical protein
VSQLEKEKQSSVNLRSSPTLSNHVKVRGTGISQTLEMLAYRRGLTDERSQSRQSERNTTPDEWCKVQQAQKAQGQVHTTQLSQLRFPRFHVVKRRRNRTVCCDEVTNFKQDRECQELQSISATC